ncbi:MAG: DUF4453 domain-containing protein [Pseudomonadota bacterium]
MIRLWFALLMLVPAPTLALQYCEDLWYTRNLAFDRAGFCFGSNLGQAVFGNDGCVGTDVAPGGRDAPVVARIKELERIAGCAIDTSQARRLSIPDIAYRAFMTDLPVATDLESACVGYRGDVLPVRAGRLSDDPVLLEVPRGGMIFYAFEPVGDWEYVLVYRDDVVIGAGWIDRLVSGESECEFFAG